MTKYQNSPRRYIFFLRAFNDIDNVTPAIYYLLKSNWEYKADIVLYKPYPNYMDDRNLNYLLDNFGERIRLKTLGWKSGKKKKQKRVLKAKTILKKILIRIGFSKYFDARRKTEKKFGNSDAIKELITGDLFPSLVIFDQNRMHAVGDLIKQLRDIGVDKIVSLPVSPFINVNVLRANEFSSLNPDIFSDKHDYSGFDQMGQTDLFYAERMQQIYQIMGKNSPMHGKVKNIGSIRYCKEWMEHRKKLFPSNSLEIERKKLNLVMMLSDPRTNTNWTEIKVAVGLLAGFDEIKLVIKPHTRAVHELDFILGENCILDAQSPSSELIDWSDAVIFWGSSIAIEAMIKQKICICLNHVHANENNIASHNAGIIVNSRDQLVEVASRLLSDDLRWSEYMPGIENFLTDIVYAGDRSTSVVDRYLQFIEVNSL